MSQQLNSDKNRLLNEYRIAWESRFSSLIGRREVLTGKAKFGIFGDGKELAQIAMARVFQKGDWRAGYYRDQTLLMACGNLTVRQFFAQLFADTDLQREPHSAGRQMNNHPATRYLNENGEWKNQLETKNTSSDISPTGGQMPRLLGLAYASKLYRLNPRLQESKYAQGFSSKGSEIAFGTIGNASTSEGLFWETINAAGVLQVPLLMSVWDDGYGISVPSKYQTTKESISTILEGFKTDNRGAGFEIFKVKGWDFAALVESYTKAAKVCREEHRPCLVHVVEMTQPQGHSTSGSHERYKSKDRLQWETDFDCLLQFKKWLIQEKIASENELSQIEAEAQRFVESEKENAWAAYVAPIEDEKNEAIQLIEDTLAALGATHLGAGLTQEIRKPGSPFRRQILATMKRTLFALRDFEGEAKTKLIRKIERYEGQYQRTYSSHLYSETAKSPLSARVTQPTYSPSSEKVDGRQVIQRFFQEAIANDPRIFIIGEDVGQMGGVNLEFDGLQEQFGPWTVTDTGIREATIFGQGLGAAMRGLRPVADIQYLDYLLYCLQGMSDDLATLHYRTAGGQIAPLIIRTKGHRLEGIWHTGSPLGMILHAIRGVHVCVPRNMTQAAGMYRTLLSGDDPGLVIESLNGYRLKEVMPDNVGIYSVPLGQIEVLREGQHVTVVSYGSTLRVILDAAQMLSQLGVEIEIIDVQTLLPFDREKQIVESLAKTNALVCIDEDVPGGASAYMLQHILEHQNGYDFLDAKPLTITAKDHRSAYASDGDYFSKPNAEQICEEIYNLMHERNPSVWPSLKF